MSTNSNDNVPQPEAKRYGYQWIATSNFRTREVVGYVPLEVKRGEINPLQFAAKPAIASHATRNRTGNPEATIHPSLAAGIRWAKGRIAFWQSSARRQDATYKAKEVVKWEKELKRLEGIAQGDTEPQPVATAPEASTPDSNPQPDPVQGETVGTDPEPVTGKGKGKKGAKSPKAPTLSKTQAKKETKRAKKNAPVVPTEPDPVEETQPEPESSPVDSDEETRKAIEGM